MEDLNEGIAARSGHPVDYVSGESQRMHKSLYAMTRALETSLFKTYVHLKMRETTKPHDL